MQEKTKTDYTKQICSRVAPTPLVFNAPTEGFPWVDLRKILPECQQMATEPTYFLVY